jgi:hypothetical protein
MMKSQQLLEGTGAGVSAGVSGSGAVSAGPSRRSSLVSLMASRDLDDVQRRRVEQQQEHEQRRGSLHRTLSGRSSGRSRKSSIESDTPTTSRSVALRDDHHELSPRQHSNQSHSHSHSQKEHEGQKVHQHELQEQFQQHQLQHQQQHTAFGRSLRGLLKLGRQNQAAIDTARRELSLSLSAPASSSIDGSGQVLNASPARSLLEAELSSLLQIQATLTAAVTSCEQYTDEISNDPQVQFDPHKTRNELQVILKDRNQILKQRRAFLEALRRQELQVQWAMAQVHKSKSRRLSPQTQTQTPILESIQKNDNISNNNKIKSRHGKGNAKRKRRLSNLASLLKHKEEQLREEGLVLRHIPSSQAHSCSQSRPPHPLDAFSSLESSATTATHLKPSQEHRPSPLHQPPSHQRKFLLGTQLEDESVFSGLDQRNGQQHSRFTAASLLSTSTIATGATQSGYNLNRGLRADKSNNWSASISRNRKVCNLN